MKSFKRHLLFVLLSWLLAAQATAQAPSWQRVAATSTASGPTASAVDGNGNLYLAGTFQGTARFGTTTLTSVGSDDIYIVKVSLSTNTYAWALRAGGTLTDHVADMAVSNGNVYLVGDFTSPTASFGSLNINKAGGTAASSDGYIAKVTDTGSAGQWAWARQIGGSDYDGVSAVAASGASVYVAANFRSAALTLGSTTLTNTGDQDIVVAKLTDAGSTASYAWATQALGDYYERATALAVQGSSVYLGGAFTSTPASFGSTDLIPAGNTTITDAFVAKLTDRGSSGTFEWAQRAGGTAQDEVTALAVSGNSVYVAGTFLGTASLGALSLINPSTGYPDIFVTKLTDAGTSSTYAWALGAGGSNSDQAEALLVRGSNVYLAGWFESPNLVIGPFNLANNSAYVKDVVVARIADAGSSAAFAWADRAGSGGHDYVNTMTSSGNNLYLAGTAELPAYFGTQVLPGPLGNSSGFWAILSDQTLATAPAHQAVGFSCAPNPAHGTTTVQLPALSASTGSSAFIISLLDALGRTVRTETVPAASRTYALNLNGLPVGLYVVRVQSGNTAYTQKLVVE